MALPRIRLLDAAAAIVDDTELVARARRGDRAAEEMIYRRHVEVVARVARRLLRDSSEASDIVQETFLIAFSKLGSLSDPSALRAWLGRIALSRVQRRWRWWRRWRTAPDEESLCDVAAPGLSPTDLAELALIDRHVGSLPSKLRVPWVLHHVVGYSLAEVAITCACSLSTVKRYLARADLALEHAMEAP